MTEDETATISSPSAGNTFYSNACTDLATRDALVEEGLVVGLREW